MLGKGDFLSLQEPFVSWRPLPKGWGGLFGGVSLIGGVVWGFGCGFGWGVRGVLRIVFLIPANPSRPSQWFYKAIFCHLGQAPVA